MKNKKTNELSDEDLLKRQKFLKAITFILSGVLFLLFCLKVISTIVKGFNASSVTPIIFLPILIINFKNLNEIKKELKLRNLSL